MVKVHEILEEKAANEVILELAKSFGYGHLIAVLRKAWAEKILLEYDIPEDMAIKAANAEPYLLAYKIKESEMPEIKINQKHYEVHTWEDLLVYSIQAPPENFEFEWNYKMSRVKEDKPKLTSDYDWIGDRDEDGSFGTHKRTRYWAKRGHYRILEATE